MFFREVFFNIINVPAAVRKILIAMKTMWRIFVALGNFGEIVKRQTFFCV